MGERPGDPNGEDNVATPDSGLGQCREFPDIVSGPGALGPEVEHLVADLWENRGPNGAVSIENVIAFEKRYNVALRKAMRLDPIGYFSKQNRSHWPQRLGVEGTEIHTAHWAFNLADLKPLRPDERQAIDSYARLWPLPVGQQLLGQAVEDIHAMGETDQFGDWSFLQAVAPFPGAEWAGWILDTEMNATRVEAFGLVELYPDPPIDWLPNEPKFRPTRVQFRITGADPHAGDIVEMCRGIADWWNSYARLTMRPGRPRTEVTYQQAQLVYWDIRDDFEEAGDKRPPSQRDVIDRLALVGSPVGITTFRDRVKAWKTSGMPWPPPRP